jgi:hypothetical protein
MSASTNWEDVYRTQTARIAELERENAALRATAVEACALARVWVTVWGDKLSAESIKRLEQLEKQVLKEAQP